MNLEDLKAALANSEDELYRGSIREGQDLEEVRDSVKKSRTRLRWRDFREFSACLFVFVVFFPVVFSSWPSMTRLGAAMSCLAAVFIAIRLFLGHRRHQVLPELSVIEFLRAETDHLDYQIRLLRMVSWWYLAPIAVGYLMFVWGLMPVTEATIASGAYFVLDRAIYWLNQSVIKNDLQPQKERLLCVYRSLTEVVEVNSVSECIEE